MTSKRKAGSPLSQAQLRAAWLLVAGLSNGQVAAKLGVHPCMIAHWKSDERFLGCLAMLQHDANEMLLKRIVAASVKALDVLEQIIDDPKISWIQKSMIVTRILAMIN